MSTETIDQIEHGTPENAQKSGTTGIDSRLMIAGVVVIILVLLAGGYWWYSSSKAEKNEKALVALSRIRSTFENGDYARALTADSVPAVENQKVLGLIAISEQYSGTPAGEEAALMAGACLVNLGRESEAVAQFEKARSSSATLVKMGASNGLAACKEANNDYAGAAELYVEAATLGNKTGFEHRSYYNAGLCYEKANQVDKAKEMLMKVAKQYSTSESAAEAKIALARLGMAID